MEKEELLDIWKRLLADYGMVLVLLALIAFFSIMTISEEEAKGKAAATELLNQINEEGAAQSVLILSNIGPDDVEMATSLAEKLQNAGHEVLGVVNGDPPSVARKLRELQEKGQAIDLIATTKNIAHWGVIQKAPAKYSIASNTAIVQPSSGKFPRFLKRDNLRNIADRISVIAILAIGMTLIIITAGIDLSVGSLIALAAVSVSLFIQNMGGDAA
ncbi:MAG: ABC transporter permease, partial [Bacteroidota bacterium]